MGDYCVGVLSSEIRDRQVRQNFRLYDASETRNNLTEEIAKHFHNASSSVYCVSILLEVEIIGKYTKCFQLRKQVLLCDAQHYAAEHK
jgi:hypothetical protein